MRVSPLTNSCDINHRKRSWALTRMWAVMAGRSKVVSIALAITMFVSPVAALSACWIPMPAVHEMAMGDAGMTANMLVGIQEGPANGSCCQVLAATAPGAAVPRVPEHGATTLATASSTSILDGPPADVGAEPAKATPRGPGSSLQATFCVFLI